MNLNSKIARIIGVTAIASGVSVGFAQQMPQIAEGADNACHAVEKKAVKALISDAKKRGEDMTSGMNAFGLAIINGIVNASKGSMAESAAQAELPNVPSTVACSARWWQASMPGGSEALARQLQEKMKDSFN